MNSLTCLVGAAALCLFLIDDAMAQATDVDCDKCVDKSDIAPGAVNKARLANGAVTNEKIRFKV